MSKANPLAGLIGYGDSDEESDDAVVDSAKAGPAPSPIRPPPMQTAPVTAEVLPANSSAAVHPAPITHCPWSACYDEGSGFTYYWNQNTNEVTWDAPREYLLALKVAQQHMQTAGSAEVSAAEWQLYQQVLAEKQTVPAKAPAKPAPVKPVVVSNKVEDKAKKYAKKRPPSCMSDDEEKIELITSYSNSDSDSNDESDKSLTPIKSSPKNKAPVVPKPAKPSNPEPRAKKKKPLVPYGPPLPPNMEYTVPIGPELPPNVEYSVPIGPELPPNVEYSVPIGPELPPNVEYTEPIGPEMPPELANGPEMKLESVEVDKSPERRSDSVTESKSGTATPKSIGTEDIHDDDELLRKLKDKAILLEKLGGEIPTELQKFIQDETKSINSSPRTVDMDVDNLLQEIEEQELPKIKSKNTDVDNLLQEIEKKELPKMKSKDMDVDNLLQEIEKKELPKMKSKDMDVDNLLQEIEKKELPKMKSKHTDKDNLLQEIEKKELPKIKSKNMDVDNMLQEIEKKELPKFKSKNIDVDNLLQEIEKKELPKIKSKNMDVDNLLQEIEKKELPKIKSKNIDVDNLLQEIEKKELPKIKSKNMDVDNLLQEIEKKELPKIKSKKVKKEIDIFEDNMETSTASSAESSPRSHEGTPPREEFKALFPSSRAIVEEEKPTSLFPSSANIEVNGISNEPRITATVEEKPPEKLVETKEKKPNIYIMDTSEPIEKVSRKKLRISNSVLPERKKAELPSYTTKYSQHIEGFSSERTGLGFTKEEDEVSAKKVVSYGNGLAFTKGEVLNEEKREEALDNIVDLLDAKLNFLHQLQPCMVPPVAEMMIQMQTLRAAFACGELTCSYWRRWLKAASEALANLEATAAPVGWSCSFARSEGRYRYRRLADGLEQWEFPVAGPTDMEISTTPPPPPLLPEDPPLPSFPPPPLPSTPPPPPPPQWDPPPPGCDDSVPPTPPPPTLTTAITSKQEIGDQLLSFYSEIGELEKTTPTPTPTSKSSSPERPPPPPPPTIVEKEKKVEEKETKSRKKTKVKISSSIGLKHKTVSSMVAKWQQVAEEINSD